MSEAQSDEPIAARPDAGGAGGPMEMCPMAEMCKGMAKKPPSLLLLMIPGLVLILGGQSDHIDRWETADSRSRSVMDAHRDHHRT